MELGILLGWGDQVYGLDLPSGSAAEMALVCREQHEAWVKLRKWLSIFVVLQAG